MCEREVIAEFLDLDSGEVFGFTGHKDETGVFVLDMEGHFVGPFFVYGSGRAAKFVRIASWKIL
jgi:hypothetical protein